MVQVLWYGSLHPCSEAGQDLKTAWKSTLERCKHTDSCLFYPRRKHSVIFHDSESENHTWLLVCGVIAKDFKYQFLKFHHCFLKGETKSKTSLNIDCTPLLRNFIYAYITSENSSSIMYSIICKTQSSKICFSHLCELLFWKAINHAI